MESHMTTENVIAERGKSVTIRYTIILEDGTRIREGATKPLTFKIGGRKILPALEEGVVGMRVNEVKQIPVSSEQGYGRYKEELVIKVDRKMFPDDIKIVPGRTVQYQNRDGERANFVVQVVENDKVVLDGNHPLAGQNLVYEVELVSL
ncbi:peptidylprolyl isomerase [Desulfopila aestuarii DSM 18488]|uniref:Peptidyl-prolyl cis-trans isomerase n=2 Tax=Desulfopila aestuarii TaxID=231440 RepID=A0A1M7XXW4_9BACT|nr:peptidylprolyl isomerase [Desulfopila aestuarii DSM 18488]